MTDIEFFQSSWSSHVLPYLATLHNQWVMIWNLFSLNTVSRLVSSVCYHFLLFEDPCVLSLSHLLYFTMSVCSSSQAYLSNMEQTIFSCVVNVQNQFWVDLFVGCWPVYEGLNGSCVRTGNHWSFYSIIVYVVGLILTHKTHTNIHTQHVLYIYCI